MNDIESLKGTPLEEKEHASPEIGSSMRDYRNPSMSSGGKKSDGEVNKQLEWTGERYLPFIDPKITGAEIHYEHLHRYAFASQFVKGKDVLDLASGEGYGSFMLSKEAKYVVGIELNQDAIAHARSRYPKEDLEFKQGSILEIPLEGEKLFDIIICFEAIEHVNDHDKLLSEVKRLLKDSGLFIVSTPNKRIYSDKTNFHNPYHVKELYYSDFIENISKYFSHMHSFGQRVYAGSSIWPLSSREASCYKDFVVEKRDDNFSFKDENEKEPLYFIVIASNANLEDRHNTRSNLVDTSNVLLNIRDIKISALTGELQDEMSRAQILVQAVEEREGRISSLTSQIQEISSKALAMEQALSDREGKISSLTSQIQEISSKALAMEQALSDRDIKISSLTSQIQEISSKALAMEQALSDREGKISSLTSQIQEISSKALAMEQALSDREGKISSLTSQIQEISSKALAMEQALSDREGKISSLTSQRSELKNKVISLEKEIAEMRKSVLWQTTMRFHNCFIEQGFPRGTKRRNAYDLLLKSSRIVANEGPGSLLWHYNERKRVKASDKELKRQTQKNIKEINDSSHEDIKIDRITFPKASVDCEVSIVIPVHNNVKLTCNCLKSISEKTKGSFEVIVVDDASVDETAKVLKKIKNIRTVKNGKNQGFLLSGNIGASFSKGKYILFLNNDTIVTDNWLEPLIDAIKRDEVGAVGAKLVYPDGKLQEAGGIIWADASGYNYGRGDNPEKPEYNFIREVDYCSGAAFLVKRELFEKLDGLDTRFKPAYYEDADLCFSIRNLGYKVLYQPRSTVVHFEGSTSGTDLTSGVKKYQVVNKIKFLEKWADILQKEHYKPDPKNLFLARSRGNNKTILVIDQYVPLFDRDAGSCRMYNILRGLVDLGHKVTFIGENFARFDPYVSKLQLHGVEVIYAPYISSIKEYLSVNGAFFDIVILSRAHIATNHIRNVKNYCKKAKILFDTVDLQFLRESRRSKVMDGQTISEKAERLKELELQIAKASDMTLVVSNIEKDILIKEEPNLKVEILSVIHSTKKLRNGFSNRRDLLFLGAYLHTPNVDAIKWFIEQIFPRIKVKIPGVKLFVVGDQPPEEITSFASKDVIVTGYVENLTPYFENCRIFVAPIRYGAGVKGKINQSMSCGLPVVTTSIGAEGMGLVDGTNALLADQPEQFSDKVVKLYNSEELWTKISKNSIDHVEKNFSYEASKKRIESIIANL